MSTSVYENMIAISNRHLCDAELAPFDPDQTARFTQQLKRVQNVCPKAIILREKDLSEEGYRLLAQAVKEALGTSDIPLILHTFTEVALSENHPYIHLPLPLLEALNRTVEGKKKLSTFTKIGTSVHSVEDAIKAEALGATYCLAGNVFETDCKAGLPGRGLDFLTNVSKATSLPIYALGGITLENKNDCIAAGATGAAMMSGFMRL